jgi:hypothetical protein
MSGAYHFLAGASLALVLPALGSMGFAAMPILVVLVIFGGLWFKYLQPFILWNRPCVFTPRSETLRIRRHKTYPLPVGVHRFFLGVWRLAVVGGPSGARRIAQAVGSVQWSAEPSAPAIVTPHQVVWQTLC